MGDRSRRVPLSLEDLKRKREEKEAALAKVVFVPKHEREKSGSPATFARASAGDAAGYDSPPRSPVSRKRPRSSAHAARVSRDATPERAAIRRHYMNEVHGTGAHASRTLPKHSERTRFKFEWDADEDTVTEADESLYRELRTAASFSRALSRRLPGMAGEDPHRGHSGTPFDRLRPADRLAAARAEYPRRSSRATGAGHDPRHWSEKTRSEMTSRDWAIFREDHAITFRGGTGDMTRPARSWDETGLPPRILQLVRDVARYTEPSPIQMAAIPAGLHGRDLIGLAETGSGKTAAFVLPMLVHIQGMPPLSPEIAIHGPYALVLAPTRELVLQIEAETRKFANPLGFRVTAVIGGQGLQEQGLALQSGCEIVVCTPGRMVDLLSRRLAVLGNCSYLIMDEADRMIDMGFEAQVQEILGAMPSEVLTNGQVVDGNRADHKSAARTRQTFMFSATMSPPVERLAREYLTKPVVVTIGEAGKAAEAVDQRVEYLPSEGRKRERLVSLIKTLDPPVIVFVNTKKGCEDVARLIESGSGIRPVVLHSGKSQDQREECLDGFRSGRFGVLVATDVLGRGIDIKGVNHVVNFELPKALAPYTHRIGRTGRAGRKGIAWSLATADDSALFGELRSYLEQSGSRVCPAIARHDAARSEGLRPIID